VCVSGAVHALRPVARMAIERLAGDARRLVTNADGLQRHWRDDAPVWRGVDLLGKPAGVLEIATEPRLQSIDALLTNQAPQLQRAEASAERNAPIAVVR